MYHNIIFNNGITMLSNGHTCECIPKWAEYVNLSISVILNVIMTVISV